MVRIEVFKTNVAAGNDATKLKALIFERFPDYQVNFDLNDCDRIMRVVCTVRKIDTASLVQLAMNSGFRIAPLPDEVPA